MAVSGYFESEGSSVISFLSGWSDIIPPDVTATLFEQNMDDNHRITGWDTYEIQPRRKTRRSDRAGA